MVLTHGAGVADRRDRLRAPSPPIDARTRYDGRISLRRANLALHGLVLLAAALAGIPVILEGSGPARYAVFLLVVLPFAHAFAAARAAAPERRDLLRAGLLWPVIAGAAQIVGTFAYALGGTAHHGGGDEGSYIAVMLGISAVQALPLLHLAAQEPNLLRDVRYRRTLARIGLVAASLLIATSLSWLIQRGLHPGADP